MNFRVPIRACLHVLRKKARSEELNVSDKIENLIYTCPASSYLYAKHITKKRIPAECENIFSKRICILQNYRDYQTKKITSNKEISIEDFNFFNKVFKQFNTANASKLNFIINVEADSPVIRNGYISLAYLYAKNIIKGRLPIEIEKIAFIEQPISCYLYIKDVLNQSFGWNDDENWIHLEEIIKKNSTVLLSYAQKIKNNLEDLELHLEPEHAVIYSKEILKSRICKKHEEIIFSKNAIAASEYAVSVVSDRLDDNLHDLIILKSLEPKPNNNIKNYLFFCYHLKIMEKAWKILVNKMEKLKIKSENFIKIDLDFCNKNEIKINDRVLVKIKPPTGTKFSHISVLSIDNETNTSKIELPFQFEIEDENCDEILNNVVSLCYYKLLKKTISKVI